MPPAAVSPNPITVISNKKYKEVTITPAPIPDTMTDSTRKIESLVNLLMPWKISHATRAANALIIKVATA